jgi:hypothetical protein
MSGICWFVQIVHYPLFREIPRADFPHYSKKNFITRRVVGPAMVLELGSAIWLLYTQYSLLLLVNMALLGMIWASTTLFQMPLHRKLSKKANPEHMAQLVSSNWIRTICWTLRCGVLGYLLL